LGATLLSWLDALVFWAMTAPVCKARPIASASAVTGVFFWLLSRCMLFPSRRFARYLVTRPGPATCEQQMTPLVIPNRNSYLQASHLAPQQSDEIHNKPIKNSMLCVKAMVAVTPQSHA